MSRQEELIHNLESKFSGWTVHSKFLYTLYAEKSDWDILTSRAELISTSSGVDLKIITTDKTLSKLTTSIFTFAFSDYSCCITGLTKQPQIFRMNDALNALEVQIKKILTQVETYRLMAAKKQQ